MDDSRNWKEIERSLALATQAETLREESRELRETSKLIREESARISRKQLAILYGETDK